MKGMNRTLKCWNEVLCIFTYLCHCRLKASNVNLKVELYMNGDQIDPSNDRKLLTQLGIRDKTVSDLV